MAVWKKLNPETGEYEEIPGASVSSGESNNGSSSSAMPNLKGKTVIFMGDSYMVAMSAMLKSMCEEFNAVSDVRAVVGSAICGAQDGAPSPMWVRTNSVCEEYKNAGTTGNVAAVVFMGGTNDVASKGYWGTGVNDTDKTKIYGALHSIYNTFYETFPDAKFFTILQPSNYGVTVPELTTDEEAQWKGFDTLAQLQAMNDYQYSEFCQFSKIRIVEEMARYYNSHIIDCCFNWHSIFSATDRETYWAGDKAHLTTVGYQDVTNKLRTKMIEVLA